MLDPAAAVPKRRVGRGPAAAGLAVLGLALLTGATACSRLPRARTDGRQTGVASWYGAEFHGRPTSSREIYDMDDMTAAHRTLPFGTSVMVTNLDNGRSAVVRINDRGPFVRGRIIDLSRAAAGVLGVIGPGTARVRLEVLRGDLAPAPPGPGGAVWVQVGAFSVQENAYAVKRRLERSFPGVLVSRFDTPHASFFRVRVSSDEASVEETARRLADEGFPVIIVRE